jgi:cell division protein ZapA (FtsZ GTPase activity inhibitor)
MGKNEKTPITVNDQEYFVEDLNEQQQAMINHVNDLDRKLANARFNLDQLAFGREAFVNALAQSLQSQEITDADYEEPADPAD